MIAKAKGELQVNFVMLVSLQTREDEVKKEKTFTKGGTVQNFRRFFDNGSLCRDLSAAVH